MRVLIARVRVVASKFRDAWRVLTGAAVIPRPDITFRTLDAAGQTWVEPAVFAKLDQHFIDCAAATTGQAALAFEHAASVLRGVHARLTVKS